MRQNKTTISALSTMGQQSSTNVQDFVTHSLAKAISTDPSNTELILSMSYDEFIAKLGELNKLSQTCFDSTGKRLLFAVRKGTDSTPFWKATVQIACVKIDPVTQKVHTYRLLSLKQFVQVFHTLQCQHSAAEQSSHVENDMNVSTFYNNLEDITRNNSSTPDSQTECCICFERKPDILLPCTHSYCLQCIEEWNEDHHTCPICREKLSSTDDSWVLSEVPKAEEISEEIRTTLMDLAVEKPSPCRQS